MTEVIDFPRVSSEQAIAPHTLTEYLAMPEGAPYYEFINGIAHFMPSPTFLHQRILARLFRRMDTFVEEHNLGITLFAPLDVYLSEEEYYQPDMLFVSNERKSIIQERIHGAPDLVVEVLSPSNGYKDLSHKKRMYEAFDVREYWILDPLEKSVEVLFNTENGFQIASKAYTRGMVKSQILSGFAVDVEQLFAE
ncbi:MAG: Uma2 family endonuclease [Candidatus Kapaibacteriota bacterium]